MFVEQDSWPSRDDQCPERGPALSHAVEGTPECVHCHQYVKNVENARNVDVPTVEFTPKEAARLRFLRWLHRVGRI